MAKAFVKEEMRLAEEERHAIERSLHEALDRSRLRLAKARVKAFRGLTEATNCAIDELQQSIRPFVQGYSGAAEQLRIEMRKLGIA